MIEIKCTHCTKTNERGKEMETVISKQVQSTNKSKISVWTYLIGRLIIYVYVLVLSLWPRLLSFPSSCRTTIDHLCAFSFIGCPIVSISSSSLYVLGKQLDKNVVLAPGSASKWVKTTATRKRHSWEASVTSSASRAALVVLKGRMKKGMGE